MSFDRNVTPHRHIKVSLNRPRAPQFETRPITRRPVPIASPQQLQYLSRAVRICAGSPQNHNSLDRQLHRISTIAQKLSIAGDHTVSSLLLKLGSGISSVVHGRFESSMTAIGSGDQTVFHDSAGASRRTFSHNTFLSC